MAIHCIQKSHTTKELNFRETFQCTKIIAVQSSLPPKKGSFYVTLLMVCEAKNALDSG